MSDDKKASKAGDNKRIIDVVHPGKSAPASTSKPVLVTNRPILKDPMVVEGASSEGAAADTAGAKILSSPAKIKLQPLSAPTLDDETGVKIISQHTPTAKTPEEKPTDTDKPQEAVKTEKPAPEVPEPPKDEPAAAPAEPAADKPAEAVEPTPVKPELVPDTPTGEQVEKPADDKLASEARSDTNPPESDQIEDKPKAEASPDEADAMAAEAAAKHETAMQALADSKKYYLPVNAVEKLRTKRVVVLGILLSVLLALAWADVALDAGLVQLGGIKPVTHFFSN